MEIYLSNSELVLTGHIFGKSDLNGLDFAMQSVNYNKWGIKNDIQWEADADSAMWTH